MTEKDVLKLFESHNALLTGHFKLSSGLHSARYLQCALVLQYPDIAAKLAKAIAKKFAGEKIDFVIGPALGGITLAYEAARAAGCRGLFAERHPSTGSGWRPELVEGRQGGAMVLRRGFSIAKGERALVVEDVVTTGGSTNEVTGLVKAMGGVVAGVGCVIDRSGRTIDFGARFESLAKVSVETFEEGACPMCKKGEPVTKPGSRK